jgi:hypothetical protein
VIKQLITYLFLAIIINSFCLSCTEPINFNQVNNFEFSPVIESSLIFLDKPALSFLDNGNQLTTIQDFVQIQFFNDNFIVENLIKAEFVFEASNSINRTFQIRVDLLNENDQIQHTFTFLTTTSINNTSVVSSYTEVFEDNSLSALKNTSKLVFTLNMLPGIPINQNTMGRIQLKSKVVLYFNIENSL